MTKEQIEQIRNIMSITLIICGIILIMNPFMPRIAAIASLGVVGMPIFIYTVWSLIYDYFASKKKKSRMENPGIYFSVKIHNRGGKARKINGGKILKTVTYAIVDKILKKDDVVFIEMEDEYGLTLTHTDISLKSLRPRKSTSLFDTFPGIYGRFLKEG